MMVKIIGYTTDRRKVTTTINSSGEVTVTIEPH